MSASKGRSWAIGLPCGRPRQWITFPKLLDRAEIRKGIKIVGHLVAQGLSPDTPWRSDSNPAGGWVAIPSEQYAEARIELEPCRRQTLIKVDVTQQPIHTMEVWAASD